MFLAGCGSESERRAVRGTVSVDQAVIARGSISFFPDRGHTGPAASTAIVDGNYRFTEVNGPTAGRHRVVIGMETDPLGVKGSDTAVPSASVIKGGPVRPGGEPALEARSSGDAVRQTQWVTAADVPAADSSEAPLPIDFDLQSQTSDEDVPAKDPP